MCARCDSNARPLAPEANASIQLSYGRIFYGIEYTQNSEKTVVDSGLSRINHGA